MARAPRLNFPDAVYHVTSRGNGRARIVYADDDRQRFLRQLEDNIATHAVRLYAWVLMDNHLLVRTPRANLSQFMQRLKRSYALDARYKHGRPGHQFEARFKAKLVEQESYLLAVSRYIHLNPIKNAACRRLGKAERVRRLEGYRWSRIDPERLKQRGRRVGMAKAVAVELSCMLTGERARTVGLHYGGIAPLTFHFLSSMLKRCGGSEISYPVPAVAHWEWNHGTYFCDRRRASVRRAD